MRRSLAASRGSRTRFFLSLRGCLFSSHLHRHFDELLRQRFELLPVGDGFLESGGFFGRNSPTEVGPFMPGLKLVVGACGAAGRVGPVFFLEAAILHGLKFGHLLEDAGAESVKIAGHTGMLSSC